MWTAGSMIYCSVEWGVPCGKNHRDISRCQLHFFKTQIWFIGVPHFYFYDQDFIDWNMKSLKPLSCNFVSPAKPSVSEKQRNAVLFHWITPEVSFPAVRLCSCESHMLSFFFFLLLFLNIKGFVRSGLVTGGHCCDVHLQVCREENTSMFGANSRFTSSSIFPSLFVQNFLYKWTPRDKHERLELTNSLHMSQAGWRMSSAVCFCRFVMSGMMLFKTWTQFFHYTHTHTHTHTHTCTLTQPAEWGDMTPLTLVSLSLRSG